MTVENVMCIEKEPGMSGWPRSQRVRHWVNRLRVRIPVVATNIYRADEWISKKRFLRKDFELTFRRTVSHREEVLTQTVFKSCFN